VSELNIKFRFEPDKFQNKEHVKEYDCLVEANIWRSDGRIVQDERASHYLIILRVLQKPVFYWGEKHVIDSLLHKQRQIRLYKHFVSERSREACRRINDHIALLVAPTQRVWIQSHDLAAQMMKEASDFLVTNYVMTT
jgi:hypothetical protein